MSTGARTADDRGRETLQVFDLMFKLILKEASPAALTRFINGLFGESYPPDSEAAFAATESVNEQRERLEKIVSDMIITIGGDAFLIEAQINDDESIALRVFQYGLAHALRTRRMSENIVTLTMPAARIIYWETSRKTPDKVTVRLVFPDKTTHDYEVEALKVLDQSLEALDRRNMALLFPFSLLKFRREARKAGRAGEERRRELAGEMKGMLREMEGFLDAGRREGRLSVGDAAMILKRMEQMYEELYGFYPEFEETKMELRERLKTHWQDYLREGERKGRREGIQEGRREGVQLGERRVIELLEQGCTLEQIKRTLAQETGR